MQLLREIQNKKQQGKKTLALLIDPDKYHEKNFEYLARQEAFIEIGLLLIGGSLITQNSFHQTLQSVRKLTALPIIIFPGSNLHIDTQADALLLLSLISGRNPELLIGQHVIAAPMLKNSGLEILPTGYILIDGGKPSTVSYISNTTPIPADKPEIAACTAMAGEMLGLKLIYADAGSGALTPVSSKVIHEIRKAVDVPIFIGGGIKTAQEMVQAFQAGADVVVLGNAIEQKPKSLEQFAHELQKLN